MRLKVEGADDILKALKKADEDLQREMNNIVAEAVEIVFGEADSRVPIKTGAARDSLKIETGVNGRGVFYANVTVGDNKTTYYVTFYELGTSRQPPRPFMRPSLDGKRNEIRKYMIKRLKEVIERQGK